MNTEMTAAELFPGLGAPDPIKERKKPDAIVLTVMHCTCLRCSTVYKYPNSHLMLRYGNNMIRTTTFDRSLPREQKHYSSTSNSCQECFQVDGETIKQRVNFLPNDFSWQA